MKYLLIFNIVEKLLCFITELRTEKKNRSGKLKKVKGEIHQLQERSTFQSNVSHINLQSTIKKKQFNF